MNRLVSRLKKRSAFSTAPNAFQSALGVTAAALVLALSPTARAQTACDADINADGSVGGADLAVLLGAWGACPGCAADVDDDGLVNGTDLSAVLGLWGSTCERLSWATVLEFAPDPAVVTSAPLRTAIAATGLPWRVRDDGTQIEMLLVPPGTFNMGCSASTQNGCGTDENPVHAVTLTNAFYIGRYEVTQAQWQARMGWNPSRFQQGSAEVSAAQVPNRPVEQVSWSVIQGFLSATGLRLPTEAEWEYACRAGTNTAFHSMPGFPNGTNDGTQVGNIAWWGSTSGGNSASQTRPVGGKAANALGLHDMTGNVNEWVNDRYSSSYYASSPSTNPAGPATGTDRVLRGGSWANSGGFLRASDRSFSSPDAYFGSAQYNGFRVARSPNAPTLASVAPSFGSTGGGTLITLTGANLSGAVGVTVGSAAASGVTVINDTTVTAVTPPGAAGPQSVAITTPYGTATLQNAITNIGEWYTVLEQSPDASIVTNATLRDAIVATGFPWRVRDNGTGVEMLLVPPGTFDMGCSASNQIGCGADENPVHTVTLTDAFYLGRYEMTQAQWTAMAGWNQSSFSTASSQVPAAQVPSRPVVYLTWNTVSGFLYPTGLRLPTEAEWEYAYRAGTTTAFHSMPGFPSGTNDDTKVGTIAWFTSNSLGQTRPVGGKAANALGFHDMSGNAWEMVSDWYSETYYASSPPTNPAGPSTALRRLVRGGSWSSTSGDLRSADRVWINPDATFNTVGFRVARTAGALARVTPSTGPTSGGTVITLTGTNLTGATGVLVGGVAATGVTVVNQTTVTAVTPPGVAGPKTVAITLPRGTATLPNAFGYSDVSVWATVLEATPNPAVVTDANLRNAIIATGFPWRVRDNGTNIELLLVPPGTFTMGCSPGDGNLGCVNNLPIRPVTLTKAFYLGRTEVTQAQWAAKMGSNPSAFQTGSAEVPSSVVEFRPVERVSWNMIQSFSSATGLRLPSEAEWEYACRAGTTTAYHSMPGFPNGTNQTSQVVYIAWCLENSRYSVCPPLANCNQTFPVGLLAANALGFHDMLGNVSEWVSDWSDTGGYAFLPPTDPMGGSSPGASLKVNRGGNWSSSPLNDRLTSGGRDALAGVEYSIAEIGFRVAKTP